MGEPTGSTIQILPPQPIKKALTSVVHIIGHLFPYNKTTGTKKPINLFIKEADNMYNIFDFDHDGELDAFEQAAEIMFLNNELFAKEDDCDGLDFNEDYDL